MTRPGLIIGVVTLTIGVHLISSSALCCPSCYGDPNSSATQGMNIAILSLLGVTGSVLGAVLAFFLYMRHRSLMIHRRFKDMLN